MSTIKGTFPFHLKIFNFFQKSFKLFQYDSKEDNLTSVAYRALKNYGIKVTFNSISDYIKSHPIYPSLKSICDFFNDNNILNYALRLDESDLINLIDPFIAHLKEAGGKVIMVYSYNKERVVYADSLNGKKMMITSEFLEKWDGVVIVIDPNELSGEADYNDKRKAEIINNALLPAAIFIFVLAALYGIYINKFFSSPPQGTILLVLISTHLAGLTFSVLLLRQELNLKTKFTDKLCHIATNTDCDAVTKSKASKIFGSITWADAGVAYFTGGLVTIFLFPESNSINILSLLSIAALPYPVFSILYQWLKIKKWCPFCLSVQFIIGIESILAFNVLKINELTIVSLMPVLVIFSVVFLIVLLMKFLFLAEREKKHSKMELLKLKRDPEVFLHKLQKGERIEIPYEKYVLIFGEKQSTVLISVFLSFHCSACAKKFDAILKLIDKNYKIKVQLILSPGKDEISVKFMKTIFRLMKTGQNRRVLEELKIWYNTDITERSKLFQFNTFHETSDDFEEMMNYNSSLFDTGKVTAVPSVYVNGYPLPGTYTLDDLRYHISELEYMQPLLNEIEVQ